MRYYCAETMHSIKDKIAIRRKDNLIFWHGGDVIGNNARCN